jgi:hypothetical protein
MQLPVLPNDSRSASVYPERPFVDQAHAIRRYLDRGNVARHSGVPVTSSREVLAVQHVFDIEQEQVGAVAAPLRRSFR